MAAAQKRTKKKALDGERLDTAASAGKAKLSDALITQGLLRLTIERHLPAEKKVAEWAIFRELRNHTGFAEGNRTTSVDVFAMHLWPSKKHWRVAYEVKASRADFLRELDKPEKRAWGMEVANEFWYVCYPGVAKPEEIPAGCGLLRADEALTRLQKVVHAPQREVRDLTMNEMAAMARSGAEEHSALFRYSGRELTEKDLVELLNSRMDAHLHHCAQARAEEEVERVLSSIQHMLKTYATDMQELGIEPPAWMKSGELRKEGFWGARKWVSENLARRIGVHQLQENARHLEQAAFVLSRQRQRFEDAEASVRQALEATQSLCRGSQVKPEPSVLEGESSAVELPRV